MKPGNKEKELIDSINGGTKDLFDQTILGLLTKMFGPIDEHYAFECTKLPNYVKPNLLIRYQNQTHFISIYKSNIVHHEDIKNFVLWIRSFGISNRTQQTILLSHYHDGTMTGAGEKKFTLQELDSILPNRIIEANKELNSHKGFINALIERCVFRGNKATNPEADYIYHQSKKNPLIVSKTQLFKLYISKNCDNLPGIHIGPISISAFNTKSKQEKIRNRLEFSWPNFDTDLMMLSNN